MGNVVLKDGVPICDFCGSLMTIFDGWAWHTCPECQNAVRIIDDDVKWRREIFGKGRALYGGRMCEFCGQPLAGGEHVSSWENGNNPSAYVKCPHCGRPNFE